MSTAVVVGGVLGTATALHAALGSRRAAAIRRRARPPEPGRHLLEAGSWLAARCERADLAWSPDVIASAWVALVTGSLLVVLLTGPSAPTIGAVVVTGFGPLVGFHVTRGRAEQRMLAGLPGALDEMARSMRTGASLPQAVADAADGCTGMLRADLDAVVRRAQAGLTLHDSLAAWADDRRRSQVDLVVAALTLGSAAGGAPSRAVEGVATTLRERQLLDAEIRAQSAQARASAVLITVAPLAFATIAAVADPAMAHFLTRQPLGIGCLVLGLALDLVGAVWMHRIARAAR